MPRDALDWRLVKSVSRSFYLTLRLLPAAVRESIALAYLLARLSDTKADGVVTAGEKELLSREPELLHQLERSPDQAEIRDVWRTIQEGQDFDTARFPPGGSLPLDAAERDRYTYLVAGCVGEFWTRLCAKRIPHFAQDSLADMAALGVRFGKGLQLINILRDRAGDENRGRVYVSEFEVPQTLALAREHLAAADEYVRNLRFWRLRAACALPLLIGRETLDLIEANPGEERVKISRNRVWMLVAKSLVY